MSRMHRLLPAVMLAAVLYATGCAVVPPDSERILAYHSEITLGEGDVLTVRERIQLRSMGRVFRRGISRDFRNAGNDEDFALVQVLRDGEAAPYFFSEVDDTIRLYVGEEDVPLPPGVHTFEIAFRTGQGVEKRGVMKDLKWNATSYSWSVPIDSASATVILPESIPRESLDVQAVTGTTKVSQQDVQYYVDAQGRLQFRARRGLGAREGMSIVVSWAPDAGPF